MEVSDVPTPTRETMTAAVAVAEPISRAADHADVPLRRVIEPIASHPEREMIVGGVVSGLAFAGVELLDAAGRLRTQDFTGATTDSQIEEWILRRHWESDGRYHMKSATDGSDLPPGLLGVVALTVREADAFSREADIDYEGFWAVVKGIRAALPQAPEQLIHDVAGGMLLGLADTGLIVYSDDLKPWPDQHRALERVLDDWQRDGTDPYMSSPWFARD